MRRRNKAKFASWLDSMSESNPEEYHNKIDRVQQMIRQMGLDAIIVSSCENLYYLTGIMPLRSVYSTPRFVPFLIPSDGETVLVAEEEFARNIRDEFKHVKNIKSYAGIPRIAGAPSHLQKVKATLDEWGKAAGKIGYEGDHISSSITKKLERFLVKAEFKCVSGVIEEMRMVKSAEEIKRIRKAAEITDTAVEIVMEDFVKTGASELEVARAFMRVANEKGAMDVWVPQIASGVRTSYLGHRPSDKKIELGDMVLLDCGVVVENYTTDITRAKVIGPPKRRQTRLLQIALDTLNKVIEYITPGIKVSEVYEFGYKELSKQAPRGIRENPYMDGHGIGIAIWERPYLKRDDETVIKPNMTLAVEPGLYPEGEFGVRFEDNILITENGAETLTKSRYLF